MGKIFGSNNTLALYLIPFVGLAIVLFGFFSGAIANSQPLDTFLLSNSIAEILDVTWLQVTVNLLMVVIGSWTITSLTAKQEIYERPNHWATLLFLLLIFTHPSLLAWNGFIPGSLFLVFALRRILPVYNQPSINSRVFDAGVFIAVAGFFQPGYWFLLLVIIFSIAIMRSFKWREFAVLLLGFTVPFYVHAFLLFWNNKLFKFWEVLTPSIDFIHLTALPIRVNVITLYVLLLLSILMIVLSMRYSTVQQRKHKQVLVLLSISLAIINLLSGGGDIGKIAGWLSVPLALLVPFFIQWFKKSWAQNLIIILLISLLVVNYIYFPASPNKIL